MAGDWIKMRVGIAQHPKVFEMAEVLSANPAYQRWLTDPVRQSVKHNATEHVTLSVTSRVTVAALLVVWGIANEVGEVRGDDLVMTRVGLSVIDEMASLPGLAEAMMAVGWLTHDSAENTLIFPHFMRHNSPSDDRLRKANAERQRRYREKQNSNVTRNVTVTHESNAEKSRAEKSREEQCKQAGPAHESAAPSAPAPLPAAAQDSFKDLCSLLLRMRCEGSGLFDPSAAEAIARHPACSRYKIIWALERVQRAVRSGKRPTSPAGYVRSLIETQEIPAAWVAARRRKELGDAGRNAQ